MKNDYISRKLLYEAFYEQQSKKFSLADALKIIRDFPSAVNESEISSDSETELIKDATFVTVWDYGYRIETKCQVNMKTKEVFNIGQVMISGLDILEREYIIIDGKDYDVSCIENSTEYWYSYS